MACRSTRRCPTVPTTRAPRTRKASACAAGTSADRDRKSTRLNSSHVESSYAVCCLKKKKNQAVATSQDAVQNQSEPQLRDETAHNDKSVHGVLNPPYQAGLRRAAVQPDRAADRNQR